MPCTFGAATTDRAAQLSSMAGATNTAGFIAGWWYPTALTAGKFYFTAAASTSTTNYGIKVGTTTSTLQMLSCTTTVGLWTATADVNVFPSGIQTDKWWFIAGCYSVSSTPAVSWAMWLGDEQTPPTAMTVVQNTAPAGTLASSNFGVVGNSSTTGTDSFQGDIATVHYLNSTCSTSYQFAIPVATGGTITTAEQTLIQQRLVNPIWQGRTPYPIWIPGRTGTVLTSYDCNTNPPTYTYTSGLTITRAGVGSPSGMSLSRRRQPAPNDQHQMLQAPALANTGF